MAVAFIRWSVDDVKSWMNTWTLHHSIPQTTISNLKHAADTHHIDGQSLIPLTHQDLKQFGLNQKDINIILKRIDALILNTYIDYMMDRAYKCTQNKHTNTYNYSDYNGNEDILDIQSDEEWEALRDSNNYPKDKRAQKKHIKQRLTPEKFMHKRKQRKQRKSANNNRYNPSIPQSIGNEDKEALNAIANNKRAQSAAKSAMNDKNIRNATMDVYKTGGNNRQKNRRLIGALGRNKKVQKAAVSVAKDKKVQKAAYNNAKKHATAKNAKKAKRGLLYFK